MEVIYPSKIRKVIHELLNAPGECSSVLRHAVEAYAARQAGGLREESEIPAIWAKYVDKVVHHAYRITDQDVETLKQAGCSEDAIFEITLCAAMGASLARLERGFTLLQGDQNAPQNS